ncbi:hypothetical protein IU469_32005 [Nocardia puris]|nr:hypothetical protein [Nocardia puris]MBF6370297.1 hypothetical protein [Nocardia puris]
MAQVEAAADGDLSGWIARACRSRLLSEQCRAVAEWEREHPVEAAAARAQHTRELLEVEAEQYARFLAEQIWRDRGGHGDEQGAGDRADAEVRARTLLAQVIGKQPE